MVESTAGGSLVKNLAMKIAAIRTRHTRCQDMLAQLDRTGENQMSLTDPDSSATAAHTHVAVGYNVEVAVDTKHKPIVEQQVTNQVLDPNLLSLTVEPAKDILGVETIDVLADRGYFKVEDIEACEKAGMTPCVPRPKRGPSFREGLFRKDDEVNGSYLCPIRRRLYAYTFWPEHGLKRIHYTNKLACEASSIRACCRAGKFCAVYRMENEAVLVRMQAHLAKRPDVLDRRRETVEHPFRTIKQWINQGAFLTPGLEKARAEFSLTALALDLRRALNIVGIEKTMAAVAA